MSILHIVGVLEQELIDDHLHRVELWSDNVNLHGTVVSLLQNGPLQFDLVRQDIILDDAKVLRNGAQQEKDDREERLLNDQATLRVNHLKVLEEALSEEVVNDVETVLVVAGLVG